jgi:hypothetical protein
VEVKTPPGSQGSNGMIEAEIGPFIFYLCIEAAHTIGWLFSFKRSPVNWSRKVIIQTLPMQLFDITFVYIQKPFRDISYNRNQS